MSYVREGGSAFFVSGGILFQNGVPTEVSCFLGVLSSHSRIYIYFARHSNDCKRAVYIYKCIYIDNRKTLYFPRFSEKVNWISQENVPPPDPSLFPAVAYVSRPVRVPARLFSTLGLDAPPTPKLKERKNVDFIFKCMDNRDRPIFIYFLKVYGLNPTIQNDIHVWLNK